MPSRLIPLTVTLLVLGAISGILLVTVGASGSPKERAGDEATGGGASAACLEGATDCNDTVGLPDGGPSDEPASPPITSGDGTGTDCSAVHNVEACGGPVNQVMVDFTADYTQADMDRASEIIRQFDPDAEMAVMERFPPAVSATVHHDSPGFCEQIVEQLEAVHGVGGASCAPYTPPSGAPDEPVSHEPGSGGVPNSGGLVDPNECNAIHNIDACTPEQLEDLGLQPPR